MDDSQENQPDAPSPKPKHAAAAAVFDELDQVGNAVAELQQRGFESQSIGIAYPKDSSASRRSSLKTTGASPDVLLAEVATAGFPRGTMGMAPWVFGGIGPMVVLGSLLEGRQQEVPDDLRSLILSLGLDEQVCPDLENRFGRGGILVTIHGEGRDPIANNILERNGGHSLAHK